MLLNGVDVVDITFPLSLCTGGLSAVIWTDFVQVFIMVIGAFVLMVISE